MNQTLTVGTKIKMALSGTEIKILRHLGEGGQGDVYEVEYGNEKESVVHKMFILWTNFVDITDSFCYDYAIFL